MLALVDLALRLALAATLLTASIPKLARPRPFYLVVVNYGVLPLRLAAPYAIALPIVEFVVGAALALGIAQRWTGALASLVFLSFAIAVGTNVARGRDMDCGCFGARHRPVGPGLLAQDLLLFAAAVVITVWSGQPNASSLSVLAVFSSAQYRLLMSVLVFVLAMVAGVLLLVTGERRSFQVPSGDGGGWGTHAET